MVSLCIFLDEKIRDINAVNDIFAALKLLGIKIYSWVEGSNIINATPNWSEPELSQRVRQIENIPGVNSVDVKVNKRVHREIRENIAISDHLEATITRFKQSRQIEIEEKNIDGENSIQFSGEDIKLVINRNTYNISYSNVVINQNSSQIRIDEKKIEELRQIDEKEKQRFHELLKKLESITTKNPEGTDNSPKLQWKIPIITMSFQAILKIIDWILSGLGLR